MGGVLGLWSFGDGWRGGEGVDGVSYILYMGDEWLEGDVMCNKKTSKGAHVQVCVALVIDLYF
jgi:hypothetical protein